MGKDEQREEMAIISSPSQKMDHHVVALEVEVPQTLHEVGTDSWFQVGVVLSTGINSAYALGYAGTIMVPLGWTGGVIGLVMSTLVSLYASTLMAKIHEYGGKRHIRYRDLAGFMYGRTAYVVVWASQYANLFLINIGFIILGGQALKAFYILFEDDHRMKLAYFIAIAGLACVLFAIAVPTLSSLRIWLAISSVFSLIYLTIAFVLALRDGMHFFLMFIKHHYFLEPRVFQKQPLYLIYWVVAWTAYILSSQTPPCGNILGINAPPRDYSIPGSKINRFFTTVGAAANLVFVFNTGMIPEIQATVRAPVVDNMLKALYFQFSLGAVPVHAVTYVGYWAYGSSSSSYLLNNVSGPVWVKALANITAFLQAIIALHIFASPTYEYLDTKYGIKGSAIAIRNVAFRALVRGGYLTLTTFLSALLPFLGDFMSLTGAISSIPLTFILPNHMYIIAMRKNLSSLQKSWHLLNVVFFSVVASAALVAAFRLIAVDSKNYHTFADL